MREQAGDITNEFAGELDQSSRNFVAYAQTQIADVVSEAFDRARALFAEAAETTTAAFIDEIQRHARRISKVSTPNSSVRVTKLAP